MKCQINNNVRHSSFNNTLLCSVRDTQGNKAPWTLVINLSTENAAVLLSVPEFAQFSTFDAEIDIDGCKPTEKGYMVPKSVTFTSPLVLGEPAMALHGLGILTGGEVQVLPEARAAAEAASVVRSEMIDMRRKEIASHEDIA